MKGNKAVRMMSALILFALIMTHVTGQMNLLQPTWLWIAAVVSFMAFQSTFTGFCPASKFCATKKDGSCCGS